ncbi:hypothetical protein LEP1GSC132_2067 [Leptospira kirschneri str. 200803703]|uniref:Uncharacterized protein n=1 Tax=Leptospira kirschneri str. 200802841 TaxID=1193047 RepID=A0A828Y6V2_9LEPT|nr:hypothetical protein LEP1GSC131_3597 [Leptospira kirschneri str. 200802841]EMO65621.1 hypothetical protein LEP1GSC132_2067 [Leptospira kirschneri str. 200803703]
MEFSTTLLYIENIIRYIVFRFKTEFILGDSVLNGGFM